MKICFNQMVLYDKASAVRLALLVVLTLFATSCIKDEEPNTECDILSIIFPSDILLRQPYISDKPEKMGSGESEKVYYSIEVMVKAGVDVTKLAPEFTLTPGATISPESGVERDFTSPQEYVTTSQDGKWHRTYVVTVKKEEPPVELQFIKYGFENVKTEESISSRRQYDIFYEVDADDPQKVTMTWASGNSGFAWSLIGSTIGNTPDVFPTFQANDGVVGKCAELVTRETGPMGSSFSPPKPIAAGNLFTGKFVLDLQNPRKSTHFGQDVVFRHTPLYFSGYFKYTPGEVYKALNENNQFVAVAGKTDECNIYSVFYEVTKDIPYLDGENVLSADNIIAVAAIRDEDRKGSSQWKKFHVPYILREGKSIDSDKLAAGAYSLTIVMSSSKDGDYFAGAVGSCLLVDELEITCD